MQIKWKVQEKPTGKYSSFEKRGFPEAFYKDGSIAAHIYSDGDDYEYVTKQKEYKSLVLRFADYSVTPWKWRQFTKRFKTIDEAKKTLSKFLSIHLEVMPII